MDQDGADKSSVDAVELQTMDPRTSDTTTNSGCKTYEDNTSKLETIESENEQSNGRTSHDSDRPDVTTPKGIDLPPFINQNWF